MLVTGIEDVLDVGDRFNISVTIESPDNFTWSISSPLIEAIDCVSKREIVLKIILWF